MGAVALTLFVAGLARRDDADDFAILALADGHAQDHGHAPSHPDDGPTVFLVAVVEIEPLQAMGVENGLCGEGEFHAMLAWIERVFGAVPFETHVATLRQ